MMIRSHKKYVDPTDVLNNVVDDMGRLTFILEFIEQVKIFLLETRRM